MRLIGGDMELRGLRDVRWAAVGQCLVLLLALAVRWPVPEFAWSHVDEWVFVEPVLRFWSGDWNPHFFYYPTLQLYLAALLYYFDFLLFSDQSPQLFLAYHFFVDAGDLLTLARGLTTVMAVATVAVAMRLGQRLYGPSAGWLAGLLLALMPLHVRFSHLAITDTPATLWIGLAVLWAVRIVQRGGRADYLLTGVFVGLAAATKYPAGLVGIVLPIAAWQRQTWLGGHRLWMAAAAALLVFGLASPYVFLDWSHFWVDLSTMGQRHLIGGGQPGDMAAWEYLALHNLRFGVGVVGGLTAVVALLSKPRTWRREEGVLLAAVAAFVALLATAGSTHMRYALPLAPLLAVLLVRPLVGQRRSVLALWMVLILAEPTYACLQMRALLSKPDTRTRARDWVRGRMPVGGYLYITSRCGRMNFPGLYYPQSRKTEFRKSFSAESLLTSYGLLSRSPGLPPVFFLWPTATLVGVVAAPGEAAVDSTLVLDYTHPLCPPEPEAERLAPMLAHVDWEAEFSPGAIEAATFDRRDWYFLPTGGWRGVEGSGPLIRVGRLPLTSASPRSPGPRELFAAMRRLTATEATAGTREPRER